MRLARFKVQNFRNIKDSGWVDVNDVTSFVGQNEAGKSNLFEALYCINPFIKDDIYDATEDWPVDDWGNKDQASNRIVCIADFDVTDEQLASFKEYAQEILDQEREDAKTEDEESSEYGNVNLPESLKVRAWRKYEGATQLKFVRNNGEYFDVEGLEQDQVSSWLAGILPKFVYIHDYEMSGEQVELDQLNQRIGQKKARKINDLTNEEKTVLVVLDLAKIDLDDLVTKSDSAEGRTIRSFDTHQASYYLTQQFQKLWSQKEVRFEINVDGPTLNIFAVDTALDFPIRLKRRSTGFRWYVSFAWKFTHASKGEFENCILLLEEPGIHLHFNGQRDLLRVFNDLSEKNTILYTTHLASMIDLENPERCRIVESIDGHVKVQSGVVSSQKAPMAVIESSLGLTSDLSGMLGNRKILIVEGGTDALILNKLSGIMQASGKNGLSNNIHIWPSQTASKTPMNAAFAIGQKWDAAVLLDSDSAGVDAAKKINENCLKPLADRTDVNFKVLMLKEVAGIKGDEAEIEDLFPEKVYREWVNEAYGIAIKEGDIGDQTEGSITSRIKKFLKTRHGKDLDKKFVLKEMLKSFDEWITEDDLPRGMAGEIEKMFTKINKALGIQT